MINELIALATHLDRKGYGKEANYLDAIIKKMSFNVELRAGSGGDFKSQFTTWWQNHEAGRHVTLGTAGDKAAAMYLKGAAGMGTNEGEMAAALFLGFSDMDLIDALRLGLHEGLGLDYSWGKDDTISIMHGETRGFSLRAMQALHSGKVNSNNFDPETGYFNDSGGQDQAVDADHSYIWEESERVNLQ